MKFLHVGYPKSASTFLQTQYFTKENGFFNLLQDPHWKLFIENQLVSAQSSYYFSSPPNLPIPEIPNSCIVGLSTENFLDGIHLVDFQIGLNRWKSLYPDTKVLIVIRKQNDLVYSNYVQYVRAGYFRSVDTYLRELIWSSQQSLWGRLYFDRVYNIARNIFEEVLVIPYELILSFDQFIDTLNTFFGVEARAENTIIRKSSSDLSQTLIRMLNLFLRYGHGKSYMSIVAAGIANSSLHEFNQVDGIDPSKTLTGRLRHKLIDRVDRIASTNFDYRGQFFAKYGELFRETFSESNRRLADVLRLDLSAYGYPGL